MYILVSPYGRGRRELANKSRLSMTSQNANYMWKQVDREIIQKYV